MSKLPDGRESIRVEAHPLPDGWTWEWQDAVFSFGGGGQPPASAFIHHEEPGYVRLIQIRDYYTSAYPTYIPDSPRLKKCTEHDVMIARYGSSGSSGDSLGRICRGLAGAYNVALAKAKPTELVTGEFLFYLLQSRYFQDPLRGQAGRSVQSGFNRDGLRMILLPIPPSPVQDGIVELLGTLDDKIEANRQVVECILDLLAATWRWWFADPPADWPVEPIGNTSVVVGGSTPSTEIEEFWDGGIAWVTPKDLSRLASPTLLSTIRTITDEGLRQISSGLLPSGSVLLSSRAPIGYLAISEIPVAVNQGFIALPPGGRLPGLYLWQWLRCNMDAIKERANGTTFLEISKASFRPLPIAVPPVPLVESWMESAGPLYRRLVSADVESRSLTTLRDTLLPKLISGQIRARDAERLVGEAV